MTHGCCFFKSSPEDMRIDFFYFYLFIFIQLQLSVFFPHRLLILDRERGREREREKHQYRREASIGCLPYAPEPGTKPTI